MAIKHQLIDNTARSDNSTAPVTNQCKLEEFLFNSVTKHDFKVDSSNIHTEDKQNIIKV